MYPRLMRRARYEISKKAPRPRMGGATQDRVFLLRFGAKKKPTHAHELRVTYPRKI
jgi:hypothetical protein